MSATLAAHRKRRMGALAGVGKTRRRRKSRRGISDIGAMFGRRKPAVASGFAGCCKSSKSMAPRP